jgi:hypothetical protein
MVVAAGDPFATSRFLGVIAGSVPVEEVFGVPDADAMDPAA